MTRRLRLLYSFPDGLGRPGIGTTAFHQVREIARRGVDVKLYCTSLHRELPDNVSVVETLAVRGRRVPHRVLGVERAYRYHDRRVAAALQRSGPHVDVVHCWPRATIDTARAASRLGLPSFREVPNTHTAHAIEAVSAEIAELGLSSAGAFSHALDAAAVAREEEEYEVASFLLVPSEYSQQTFLDRGIRPDKLVLHRYGYEPERFPTLPDRARRGDRPFTAIFVGRCEPRKGLHFALQAWLDSGAGETGRFLVCGSFVPGYRERLESLLAHPSIDVRGYVGDPAGLMRESDVFVLPSIEEGSALVTYEARASGCVLVVSTAAGARCRHGAEGLVHAPRDVAALTEHLRSLRTDPELLHRLRSASLERVPGLTWAAAAEELVEIYEQHART
jgi:glycosyltransferase involved in cell wall biosynthesis